MRRILKRTLRLYHIDLDWKIFTPHDDFLWSIQLIFVFCYWTTSAPTSPLLSIIPIVSQSVLSSHWWNLLVVHTDPRRLRWMQLWNRVTWWRRMIKNGWHLNNPPWSILLFSMRRSWRRSILCYLMNINIDFKLLIIVILFLNSRLYFFRRVSILHRNICFMLHPSHIILKFRINFYLSKRIPLILIFLLFLNTSHRSFHHFDSLNKPMILYIQKSP